jgi:glutathione S-transferase
MMDLIGLAWMIIAPLVGLSFENVYFKSSCSVLYIPSSVLPFVSRLYGGVLLINVVGSSLVLLVLSAKVTRARTICKDKALRDGDSDAEARFSYPKLYAEGFSSVANDFNCIQRGHQHALETYPSFLAMSLIAGIKFPMVACISGLIWSIARIKWAEGYASGVPSKRNESCWAKGGWMSFITLMVAAVASIFSFFDFMK